MSKGSVKGSRTESPAGSVVLSEVSLSLSNADQAGGGGGGGRQGVRTPPGKSQVIWVSNFL